MAIEREETVLDIKLNRAEMAIREAIDNLESAARETEYTNDEIIVALGRARQAKDAMFDIDVSAVEAE